MQIGQVLTDEQRHDYETHLQSALNSANKNLTSLNGRSLSSQQQTMRTQVESFMRQAQEASKSDLVTARSLAERAALLSQDLLDSFQ